VAALLLNPRDVNHSTVNLNDEIRPTVAHTGESAEHWLDEHGDALFAYAIARVEQPAAAEDLVGETLLAGIEGLKNFKGGASARTWLISIMKNKIVDRIRKLRREEPLDLDTLDEQEWQSKFDASGHWVVKPNEWGDPAAVVENSALGRAMMSCISKLPEQLRTLIVMRDIDGYETDELVEILNLSSANNLWVMLSRGREKLRTCLDRNWFKER
jgi:RNA polymerase sigma-70 factor (TIGR02943 family)